MKTFFEIKGPGSILLLLVAGIVILALAIVIPITLIWVTWNAFVFEVCHGPYFTIWQAALLTAIIAISFKLVFQPQISFEIKRVSESEDIEKTLKKLKNGDSSKK